MKKIFILLICLSGINSVLGQVTTSSISGNVKTSDGFVLEGSPVVATHLPSGTIYGVDSRADGKFNLEGLRVGGPYRIEISYIGFESDIQSDIYLYLGKDHKISVILKDSSVALNEVLITSDKNFASSRTGTGTNIGAKQIKKLPTISRGLEDFSRLTPQANFRNGNLTVAGLGNRFNDIRIDGAKNSDPYGRNPNGQNGGQTNVNVLSLDAVEQVQVNLSPYEITQSGFGGASINAVTRSGSNQFSGSIYRFNRNENMSGKTPTSDDSVERTKLSPFEEYQMGFRLGGKIIKNKLFFFVNAEKTKSDAPLNFMPGTSESNITSDEMNQVKDYLLNEFNYNPGPWENVSPRPTSTKFLTRIDWNINPKNNLMVRYHMTEGKAITNITRDPIRAQFQNLPRSQVSTTKSIGLELNSQLSDNVSNNLRISSVSVNDSRQPYDGVIFPEIDIRDGSNRIEVGGYADLDKLKNRTFNFTNNLKIYKGKNTYTAGVSLEKTYTKHERVSDYYSNYLFKSLSDFLNDNVGTIKRTYSITGDSKDITADFNIYLFSLYGQDEIDINDNLKVNLGLRLDIPHFPDNARSIPEIDDNTNFNGYKSGLMPKTKIHWNPRFSFNWDANGEGKTQLRGGLGMFMGNITSSVYAGMFQNNGLLTSFSIKNPGIGLSGSATQPDYTDITGNPASASKYAVELMDPNRKLLQLIRSNIAIDKNLGNGLVVSGELMYSKLINDVNYSNLNLGDPVGTLDGADTRPLYNDAAPIDSRFNEVIYITNQSDAKSFTATLQIQKNWNKNLATSLAYNNTTATNKFESVSVFNTTNWQRQVHANGSNNLDVAPSRDEIKHRFIGTGAFTLDKGIFSRNNLNIAMVYTGSSGRRFSYVYDNDPLKVTLNNTSNTLIYIPKNESEIVLSDPTEWALLDAFIENDPYLSKNRGKVAGRNAAKMPWEHNVDLRLAQELNFKIKGKVNTIEVTFDIFNFTNFLNKKWGLKYREFGPGYSEILIHNGYVSGTNTPKYDFKQELTEGWYVSDDVSSILESSRWLGQLGLRYSF